MKHIRAHQPGDILFSEGEEGIEMFVIGRGKVVLTREVNGSQVKVAELGPGDFLGEMAILTGCKRSCTATAIAETSLLSYDKKRFMQLINENSGIAVRMLEVISARLKETTNKLVEMHDKDNFLDHY